MTGIKNMEQAAVLTLKEQVAYQPGQVVSKTLAQNDALSVTLFAFDKGEEISTHESGGDAFVTCLDGVGRITIDGVRYELHEGESIVMPARRIRPRAVQNAAGRGFLSTKSRPDGRLLCISNSADHACLSASISRLC